jgi:hypothetical protein
MGYHPAKSLKADVAQLVEQPIRNRQVSGSSPLVGSILGLTSSIRTYPNTPAEGGLLFQRVLSEG